MMPLPKMYADLEKESGPKVIVEGLKLYGTTEIPGQKSNPRILGWADAVGVGDEYTNDDIAWCGLYVAIVCLRAEKPVVKNPLWARNWLNWGVKIAPEDVGLGDVLVFERDGGGGHVAFYVGEDKEGYYHILGGNQSNQVNIARIKKSRLLGVRRPAWKIAQPANVRRIWRSATGKVSTNEA